MCVCGIGSRSHILTRRGKKKAVSSQPANSFMPRSNKSGVTILNSTSLILIGGTPFSIASVGLCQQRDILMTA